MEQSLQSPDLSVLSRHVSAEDVAGLLNSSEAILADLAKVFFEGTGQESAGNSDYGATVPLPNIADRYRALIEQIPAVVFMAHLGGGLGEAYVSPQIENLLGFTQQEWLEDPVRWYRQVHPDDKMRWSVEAAEIFLTGKPLRSAYRVLARDGRVIWFQCEARMVRWTDGRPWFIHGVGFDITNLKQTETALQGERNLVSTILDTVGALVVVLDQRGRIIRFNRAAQEITGYSFDVLNGQVIWERLMDGEGATGFREAFFAAYRSEKRVEGEATWQAKNHDSRTIAYSITWLHGVGDMPPVLIVGGIDITERKRLEKLALAREAAKTEEAVDLLQRSIDSMAESFFLVDLEGHIRKSNIAAGEMFGFGNTGAVGKSLDSVLATPDIPRTPAMLFARSPEGRCYLETEMRLPAWPNPRAVSVSCAVVRDLKRSITGVVLVFQDITQRREAEQALRRTEKLAATGRLAATIAHEINNPLESVTNLLYMARRDLRPGTRVRKYLELADQELERVAHLAKQTLGFYRDSRSPSTFNVGTSIEDVLALYARRSASRNVLIEKRLESDVIAFGFPGEFRQVISNLVVNAIDAMADQGGRMLVRLRSVTAHGGRMDMRITIADTGSGIPPDQRGRIFEAFFTTKTRVGTGLGLWLSRSIVQKRGGKILVRSSVNSSRSGTVFIVIWPLNPSLVVREPDEAS